jgi:response regulator RpfG family c-di-GMP phosphodiesterase
MFPIDLFMNIQDQGRVSILDSKAVVQPRSNGSKPIRVLMADPDESLHSMYQEPLFQEGFEVVMAFNGLECVAWLRNHIPDLLVLEPQLPWGGGDGVLAIMGEVLDLAAVPVMVLTSCRDPLVLDRMARFPISDYYVKPLAPDRLAGRLHVMLSRRGPRNASAEKNSRLKCLIARRTGRRVRNLRVDTMNGRIIVGGCADSFHVKQLVIAAVQESLETTESAPGRIDLNIDVLCGD